MKKMLAIAFAAGLLVLGALWLRTLLASDATRIRWLLQSMARGFDTSSPRRALQGLAEDFREETTGLTKGEIHEALAYVFLSQRDPKTKEFLFKVSLGEPEMKISESGSPRTADLRVEATFHRRAGGSWRPEWQVAIQARLEKRSEGWRIVRSTHQSLSGRLPF